MDETISFRTKVTVDDALIVGKFLRNQSWLYRYDIVLTSSIVFFAFWLAIVVMSDEVSAINAIGATVFSAIPAVLVTILIALYHRLIIPVLTRRRVKKIFKSVPAADEEMLITLSKEGVEMKGELSSGILKWDGVTKVVESESHLLFYSSSAPPFLYFRLSELDSDNSRDSLKRLVRNKLGDRAYMS